MFLLLYYCINHIKVLRSYFHQDFFLRQGWGLCWLSKLGDKPSIRNFFSWKLGYIFYFMPGFWKFARVTLNQQPFHGMRKIRAKLLLQSVTWKTIKSLVHWNHQWNAESITRNQQQSNHSFSKCHHKRRENSIRIEWWLYHESFQRKRKCLHSGKLQTIQTDCSCSEGNWKNSKKTK